MIPIDQRPNAVLILRELENRPLTMYSAARLLRLAPRNAMRWLLRLEAMNRIHVGGWEEPSRGRKRPVYSLGAGTEAPRPVIRTDSERARARRLARKHVRRDPLVAALFGKPRKAR